ncbi:MAG: Gfo/Idh/MocA family oxidoreductase [Lentisphaerae bacterium]|nr:Gfo/Idh/MocA family oxidoreductase [Lentisphaerota bacterium]
MLKVGVIGIGMMGSTHLDAYAKLKGVKVVAVADIIEERREGRTVAAGNVKGQSQGGVDFSRFRKYGEGLRLIADPDLDVVDVCLPTPLHARYAIAALKAGKHVLTEKPFARNSREAARLVAAARRAKPMLMCAMCMRFWPAWAWLQETVAARTHGRVLAAQFRRVASHPGGSFYSDGDACGGAILDLHIHDTDFVQHCFGKPDAVFTRGYARDTNHLDHVVTQYQYKNIPLVVAEGGWAMAPGFGFQMQYTVNFERATVVFDLAAKDQLTLVIGGKQTPVKVKAGMGYEHEIAYFMDCIRKGVRPRAVEPASAALSVKIVEAEIRSARTGKPVRV